MWHPDKRADVLQTLSVRKRIRIIKNLEDKIRKEAPSFLKYHPMTAGGLMTAHFTYFLVTKQVKDVISSIRKNKIKHYFYRVYFVDESGKLAVVVSLRELMPQNQPRN